MVILIILTRCFNLVKYADTMRMFKWLQSLLVSVFSTLSLLLVSVYSTLSLLRQWRFFICQKYPHLPFLPQFQAIWVGLRCVQILSRSDHVQQPCALIGEQNERSEMWPSQLKFHFTFKLFGSFIFLELLYWYAK